jgi:hypothetical protein
LVLVVQVEPEAPEEQAAVLARLEALLLLAVVVEQITLVALQLA